MKKKILLVRLSSLGDVVFNIPLANVLKKNGFEVAWAVSEKGIDVVKDNPAVDKVFFIPIKKWKERGFSLKSFFEYLSILKQIRSEHFDIAIDTQMMFKSMLWMKFCGAKRRICYDNGREFSSFGGNEHFSPKDYPTPSQSTVFYHLKYAQYLGLQGVNEVKYTLPPSTDDVKTKIDKLLESLDKSKPVVVICPATTRRLKHWNKDNWKVLVEAIKDKCSLVFTGTNTDKDLISYISEDKFLNLAGQTNIKELIELFSRAKIVLAPDSGSAHLARATEIPAVISIFCSTPANVFGPFGDDKKYFAIDGKLKCQPCYAKICPLKGEGFEQCVNHPHPQEIINIVNKLLQN